MFYTITTYFDPIGNKNLTNKCPDCKKSESLELTFYQKRIEGPFSTKITKKVSGILYCHNTKTEISPVQWTKDIEDVFNTEKQRLTLQPKSTKYNKWFYGLLIFLVIAAITIVSLFMIEANSIQKIEEGVQNVKVGDKFEILYSNPQLPESPIGVNTWFLVRKVEGDIVQLQRHKKIDKERSESFQLEDTKFTEEVLEVSLKEFKKRNFMSNDYSKHQFTGLITDVKNE